MHITEEIEGKDFAVTVLIWMSLIIKVHENLAHWKLTTVVIPPTTL